MSALPHTDLISVADYLAGEEQSPIKHEYLGGVVYAMAGARVRHNNVAGSCFASLYIRLRGKPCHPYNSDMKVRVQSSTQTRFYYPDVSVVCQSNPDDAAYQDQPVVIVEVLSRDTRRTDEGEKRDAYLTIPSLRVYLLVEPDRPLVIAYRRGDQGFSREVYQGEETVIPLPEVETELPLRELYEGTT